MSFEARLNRILLEAVQPNDLKEIEEALKDIMSGKVFGRLARKKLEYIETRRDELERQGFKVKLIDKAQKKVDAVEGGEHGPDPFTKTFLARGYQGAVGR